MCNLQWHTSLFRIIYRVHYRYRWRNLMNITTPTVSTTTTHQSKLSTCGSTNKKVNTAVILDPTKHIWSPDSAYPSYPKIPSAARTSVLSHTTTGYGERTLSTLTSTRFPSSVTRSMTYSSSLSSTGSASRIRFSRTRTARITRRSIGQTT